MNINSLFQSNYLRATDLRGQPRRVTIESCASEKLGEGEIKPVVKFHGVPKGLVLNKTNSMLLASVFGPETDNWTGRGIELATEMVMFQGRAVPGIRVRVAATQAPAAFAPSSNAAPPQAPLPAADKPAADPSPPETQQQAAPDPQAPAQEKINWD
jgi:hypothetical protein